MQCPKCKSTVPDDSNFCEICGIELRKMPEKQPSPSSDIRKPAEQPPSQDMAPGDNYDKIMTVKNWITMFIILIIPLVNFIMIIVWALGSSVNKNKQNYIRAMLLITLIMMILSGVIALILLIISLISGGDFLSSIPFLQGG